MNSLRPSDKNVCTVWQEQQRTKALVLICFVIAVASLALCFKHISKRRFWAKFRQQHKFKELHLS